MKDDIQDMIIPAEQKSEVCVIHEVHYNEIERRVTLVTAGWDRPALNACIECVRGIYPDFGRIRVMTSETFDLLPICIFGPTDVDWRCLLPLWARNRAK